MLPLFYVGDLQHHTRCFFTLYSEIMAFTVCRLGLLTFNICHTLFTLMLCSEVEIPFILIVIVSHPLEMECLYYLIGYTIDGSVGAQLNVDNPSQPYFK